MIRANGLFAGVATESLEAVLGGAGCRVVAYADGEEIHSPECGERLAGLVLDGKATVTTPDLQRQTLLRYLERGAAFGIANLFTDAPFVSRIVAQGSCRVLLMPEAAVRELMERDRAFLSNYLAFLSGRIQYLNRKIGFLTAGSPERRLALYLLSLGGNPVTPDVSLSALSEMLGVGRASLYRAFDRLREDGFLIKQGRSFTLTRPEAMRDAYR